MYALKRQFRIWRHELSEAWRPIGFYGRVCLGTAVSLGLALLMVRTVIRPLNEEIDRLKNGLVVPDSLVLENDAQIIMYRDRAEKLRGSLTVWTARLDSFKKEQNRLLEEVHLEVISALQAVFDRCGLMLVSETMVQPSDSMPLAKQKEGGLSPVPQKPLKTFTHRYKLRGGFRQAQAMLLLAAELPWRFEIRDITLQSSKNMPQELQIHFTLDIYYLADT